VLRGVFGRVPAPWPFFPGIGVPRWTTEGLATWYESHFSHAGRVAGTYHDMIVRTAALEGGMPTLDRASGDSPIWPGGTRAYAYGSLFFEYLLKKYGNDRMGAFADAVAGQWIPYRLNAAARDAFGHSLSDEWKAWTKAVDQEGQRLKAQAEAVGALTRAERLTSAGRVELYPRVSRDGTTLAWSAADGRSDAQIRVAGPGGADARERTRTNGIATFDWAPDGTLVMSQLEFDDPYRAYADLYRVDPSGSEHRLTTGARLDHPSVSPDGAWAAAVQDGEGTNGLVRVDLATGEVRELVAPDPDVHWAFPAISPDGRWIAVSRWTPGAHLDVVVLDAGSGSVVLTLTDDRAMDLAPAWSPDGHWVLWGSDRTGIPNILASEVDPDAGRAGAPRMGTNVLTGAEYPSVDASGHWLYFSGYHAEGWEVERIAFDPASWPRAPAALSRFDAPPRSRALQDAQAPGPVTDYSPWSTLGPTYWEPLFRAPVRTGSVRTQDGGVIPGRELLGTAVGIQTSGYDLVGRHSFSAFARVFTSGATDTDWGVSYTYAGLGNPILSIGASQFWDDDGPRLGQLADTLPVDTLFVLQRDRNVSASLTLLRQRWRRALSVTFSGGLSWEHQELLDNALRPSDRYRLVRPERRYTDGRVTLAYSTARTFSYQLGAAEGMSILLRGRVKREMQVPDSLVGVAGHDGSVDEGLGVLRLFHALGGPGYASHVIGLRASGGVAGGPGADPGYFEVGGASGAVESLTGFSLFGGSPLLYPVRGYAEARRTGRLAWSATAEYRFPLAVVNRGLGAWPLNMDRLMGSVFFDAGNAWGPDTWFTGFQNPRRSTLASSGAELIADVLTFFQVPLTVRVGAAVPLVEGSGTQVYVRLGLSF
jgi:Tol biopolymer transport system component